jgi:hypothetical protein
MKSKDEDAIVLAMQQISDRLPDFGTYQKIYPDPALGLMHIGMSFCSHVKQYLTSKDLHLVSRSAFIQP